MKNFGRNEYCFWCIAARLYLRKPSGDASSRQKAHAAIHKRVGLYAQLGSIYARHQTNPCRCAWEQAIALPKDQNTIARSQMPLSIAACGRIPRFSSQGNTLHNTLRLRPCIRLCRNNGFTTRQRIFIVLQKLSSNYRCTRRIAS